ncbi:MAG: hypothetical protein H7X97_11600 [Opitutaceae bacterium]|nr:hypothetical protein [Verrucomicrobiales bacterium]
MSDLQVIQQAVELTARRRRWQRAWSAAWKGLLIGCVLWLISLLLFKMLPIPMETLTWSGVAAALFVVTGFLIGWLRPLSVPETARWLDERQALQQRLGTALEMADQKVDPKWKELLLADAAGHAKKVDLKMLLPFSLPQASRWALLILAIGAGLGFVPEYRSSSYLQKKKEKEVIKEVGQQVALLTRRSLENRPPALEETKQALGQAALFGDELTQKPISRTDALKDLANVTEKLKQELKELEKNPSLKPLERAARESSSKNGASPSDLQKQIESLQKGQGNQTASPDQMDKLKDALKQAQKAAAGMPAKDSPGGAEARQQMTQSLSDLARQSREMGVSMPSLDEAIAALQADQTDLFLKDLNIASTDLEKLADMSKTLQQLQQQAAKLGKDLAEQLKNGQAELAQETLKKMIDQLKSSNLSKEQLDKMLKEVSKAVDPAGQYGKVADFLAKATKQMQQGDKTNSAQSLAEASKELQKLMDQMGDAESLAATLDALKKAQMCLSQCKGWGECQNPGFGMNGSKGGRGVGTWAEENGWVLPKYSELWDNSGIDRPDLDPKGHSDRGDGQLSDAAVPTKVRGQFSPGGSMPSITLKGVSIKGQSTVGYQEAVKAAQSDAQAALNQDQVPRAYQGAVKEYFDDLKK